MPQTINSKLSSSDAFQETPICIAHVDLPLNRAAKTWSRPGANPTFIHAATSAKTCIPIITERDVPTPYLHANNAAVAPQMYKPHARDDDNDVKARTSETERIIRAIFPARRKFSAAQTDRRRVGGTASVTRHHTPSV